MRKPFIPPDIRWQLGYGEEGNAGSASGIEEPPVSSNDYLSEIARNTYRLASLRMITQGITARSVTIASTPTLVIRAPRDRAYTIINPTASIGLTTSAILMNPTAIAVAGNTQATPLGVANYDSLHLFLSVASASGLILNVISQVRSPINNGWIDVQDVYPSNITGNSEFYFNLGNFGIVGEFAVRWTITGSCVLAVGYTLKGGLGGSSGGISNTIYLGNSGVTIQSGYPILEGQWRDFYLAENAELWAVSLNTIIVNVIELA